MIWCWVASPQSNNQTSPLSRSARDEWFRVGEGWAEAVPRKVIPSEDIGVRMRGRENLVVIYDSMNCLGAAGVAAERKKKNNQLSVRTRIRTWVVAELRYHNTTI